MLVAITNLTNGTQVGHRNGLTAAGVVGHGDHDQRHPFTPDLLDGPNESVDIHVAFERILRCRIPALGDHQVTGLSSLILDVGPRRIEVRVVRNHVTCADHGGEEDLLRGPALMRGDDLLEVVRSAMTSRNR